jgi:hypothetical protein
VTPYPPTFATITEGSNTDFDTKRQCRHYYQQVNHVAIDGSITQTKWSHMRITFSAQDVNLASFPHTDTMIVTVHINRWDVTKILIDNGSQAEILFLTAIEKCVSTENSSKNRQSPSTASVGKESNRSGSSP